MTDPEVAQAHATLDRLGISRRAAHLGDRLLSLPARIEMAYNWGRQEQAQQDAAQLAKLDAVKTWLAAQRGYLDPEQQRSLAALL